ncbi:putative proton pump-interactor [Rosa chinensis]|uniref:Putative proton pump-interactor n=1 Tax=Rosa chinensis TaxID=74649 RepID=A0A2P6QAQ1_ROSCH|nr:putative proton pump-interactor [Rosa chinensis]
MMLKHLKSLLMQMFVKQLLIYRHSLLNVVAVFKRFDIFDRWRNLSQWNSKKDFRDEYEKRILLSLDGRQLSRDGRIRNPDEKPLVVHEVSTPIVVESATKANTKQVKEDGRSAPLDSLPVQKVQKEAKSKAVPPKSTVDEDKEIYGLEKPKQDSKVEEDEKRRGNF